MLTYNCKKEEYDVYIGRPSDWGNPWVINKKQSRDFVIKKYKVYLNTRPDLILRCMKELRGKKLGCFCSKKEDCHGDLLVKQANSPFVINWFSNMIPLDEPFKYDGITFNTVESFYQAMKLPKGSHQDRKYIASLDGYKAKKLIKNYTYREDLTTDLKIEIMQYGIRKKFKENTSHFELLMMTEDWDITEWNNWNDKFWGKSIFDKDGKNFLGLILETIRNEYREKYEHLHKSTST